MIYWWRPTAGLSRLILKPADIRPKKTPMSTTAPSWISMRCYSRETAMSRLPTAICFFSGRSPMRWAWLISKQNLSAWMSRPRAACRCSSKPTILSPAPSLRRMRRANTAIIASNDAPRSRAARNYQVKEQSRMTREEWRKYFTGHWNFAGEKQNGHVAMLPEELPSRLIKMFSFAGEVVVDPFLGSGTTARAARALGRNSLGYEINKEFLSLIKEKIGVDSSSLFGDKDAFEFVMQTKHNSKLKNDDRRYQKKSAAMSNRINDPDHWRELQRKRSITIPIV
ncbi:MAG: site-specific DNA-methyltransferase [Candidatus Sungbacteria bacterium]|uniref:Methyltransferase n=1 Tax=Candidatus Sungiibacteriota bacterium TaxID=2750080 RepID=A0A932R0H2_9BACT|nr:site-specific DNA-methyltransferase [Candidatus Sungbacteria bacterium]